MDADKLYLVLQFIFYKVLMDIFLTINSEQLQHSSREKLLGIKIDSNLNWKNQID